MREEPGLGLRQPGQELEAEVLGDQPVVAGERLGRRRRPGAPAPQRERGEIEPGRPALGPRGQVGDLGRVELDARAAQQRGRLLLVEPEIGHADLVQPPLRPPAGEGQGGLLPARDGDLRPRRNVLGTARRARRGRPGSRWRAGRRAPAPGALQRRQRAPEARDARRPVRAARAGQRVEDLGRERLDAIERGRDVPHEQDGVVVPPVEGDPREGARIRLGPQPSSVVLPYPAGAMTLANGSGDAHRGAITSVFDDDAGSKRRRRELRLDEVDRGMVRDRHGRESYIAPSPLGNEQRVVAAGRGLGRPRLQATGMRESRVGLRPRSA